VSSAGNRCFWNTDNIYFSPLPFPIHNFESVAKFNRMIWSREVWSTGRRLALTGCGQSAEYLTQTRKETRPILKSVLEYYPVSVGGERINSKAVRHFVQPAVRKYFADCVVTFIYICCTMTENWTQDADLVVGYLPLSVHVWSENAERIHIEFGMELTLWVNGPDSSWLESFNYNSCFTCGPDWIYNFSD
jgi:hypothetical protein